MIEPEQTDLTLRVISLMDSAPFAVGQKYD
jgi:hypothetical protein